MIKVFVYSSSSSKFRNNIVSSFKNVDIIFCNSNKITREEAIYSNPNQWILFVDDDCVVDDDLIKKAKELIQQAPQYTDVVYSGTYKNSKDASYIQRAHNFIANLWCAASYSNNSAYPFILGGIFLVHATKRDYSLIFSERFWGAEDKLMSINLKNNGFLILKAENFEVIHSTNSSFSHFIRRAWLHGVNEVKYLEKHKNTRSYQFLIGNIGVVNMYFAPLILLHFFVQRIAMQFQKVRQLSRL